MKINTYRFKVLPCADWISIVWGIVRAVALILWILGGLIIELVLFPWLRGGPVKRRVIQVWHRGVLCILRVRLSKKGALSQQLSLMCANHISWLDVLVIGASMPVCFISKSEVKSWPVIGRLAALAGTLFVDRNGKNLYAVQSAIKASFASYNSVVFFPEGTTGAGDCVYPFKATLFRTAVVEGLPVQPLSIAYGPTRAQRRQAAYIDDDNFVKHLWSLLKSPPIQAQLEVLEPIFASFDPDVTTDPEAGLFTRPSRQTVAMARAMADRARQVIVAAQSDVANGRYAEAPTGGHRLLGHVHH